MDPTLPNDRIARGVDGLLSALGGAALPLWLAVVVGLIGAVAWTVVREQRTGESPSVPRYLGLTLLLVAWARWPAVALSGRANPDEHVWIAAAALLRAQPIPWLAVDTTTGGMLVPIPLMLGSFFVGDAAWGTSRAVAILLWLVTLAVLYAALHLRFGGRIARLALLPTVATVAAFRDQFEFLSYNSEHVGNLIVAGGLALDALLLRADRDHGGAGASPRAFVLGAVLGLAPWAKLQVAPIAAALGLWRLAVTLRRKRWGRGAVLVAGALTPTAVFVAFLASTGALHDFWISYVRQVLHYAGAGLSGMFGGEVVPFRTVLMEYPLYILLRPALLPVALAAATLVAYVAWLLARRRVAPDAALVPGLLLVGVAAWVTMQTREVYGHYLLLLIPPLTLLIGALLRVVDEGARGAGTAASPAAPVRSRTGLEFLGAFFVLPALVLLGLPDPAFDPEARARGPAVGVPDAVAAIAEWTEPGDRVAVWGWPAALLIETGTLAGTRDVHTERQLLAGPYQEYFTERYVADLARYRPVLFVDGLPPDVDAALMRFDQIEVVRRAIEANYVPAGSFDGIRIYRRADTVDGGEGDVPTGAEP